MGGNRAQAQNDELAQLSSERDPFSDTAEEIAFFPGGHRRQYLESLLHLTRFGRPIMVVSGPDGIGKTLLKEQFIAFVDESAFTVIEIEPTLETEADFYAELCHQLGVRTAGMSRDDLDGVLLQFAEDLGLQAKTLVIVVDDAHALNDQALKALFSLCREAETRSCQLHFILFGAQTLIDLIEQDGFGGEFSAFGQTLLMDPLSEEETREYIHYRLESAGIPSVEFSRNQMQTIYFNSGGVPSEINRYAHTFMTQTNIVKPGGISTGFQWIAGGAIAAMFAVGVFIARETSTNSANPLADAGAPAVISGSDEAGSVTLPPPLESKPVIDATSSSAASIAMAPTSGAPTTFESAAPNEGLDKPVTPPSVASVPPVLPNSVSSVKPSVAGPSVAIAHPAKATVAAKPVSPPEKSAAVVGRSLAVAQKGATKAEVKPSAKPAVAAIKPPVAPAKLELSKKTEPSPSAKALAAEKAIADKAGSVKAAEKNGAKDPQGLLALSPQRFTLQLLGAKDEAKVKTFIALHKTAGDFAYFKTRNQNGDWYVVVTGDYASRDQAKAAIAQLPQDLQANKPWPRSLQTVHEDIQKAK